jgi:dTDP-4-amino-4,6-dideoxygalactose transaminase
MYRIGQEEIEAVARVINAKALFKINDSLRETFHAEEEFKALFKVEHALLMTSGHAALTSALVAMGIGPGDEVIVPAYTYIATAMAVIAAGAIPIVVDIDETLTISPEAIEKAINERTKAIIPVHIQGFPCNMDAIGNIAKKHGLLVLEDACQADGGSFKNRRLGTIGNAGAFSFNYFKVITAGEGGALVTNDKAIFEKALIYHDSSAVAFFGNQLDGVDSLPVCGSEFRTNEIASAILRVQLTRLDGILADLRKNKAYIMTALKDCARFAPSNDIDGDCGTTVAFSFDDTQAAIDFASKTGGVRPYDTGKHVYTNWTPFLQRRGAFHPAMDPFKMKENANSNPDYTENACPKTLDILARTVYISVNPDNGKAELDALIEKLKKAL